MYTGTVQFESLSWDNDFNIGDISRQFSSRDTPNLRTDFSEKSENSCGSFSQIGAGFHMSSKLKLKKHILRPCFLGISGHFKSIGPHF